MQWEYQFECIDVTEDGNDLRKLEVTLNNEFGKHGWEAVSVWGNKDGSTFILFKRAVKVASA